MIYYVRKNDDIIYYFSVILQCILIIYDKLRILSTEKNVSLGWRFPQRFGIMIAGAKTAAKPWPRKTEHTMPSIWIVRFAAVFYPVARRQRLFFENFINPASFPFQTFLHILSKRYAEGKYYISPLSPYTRYVPALDIEIFSNCMGKVGNRTNPVFPSLYFSEWVLESEEFKSHIQTSSAQNEKACSIQIILLIIMNEHA